MIGPAEAQPYSASWWEKQSHEQLQEFIRVGFSGGTQYDGAHRELERRSQEAARRAREAAAMRIQNRKDRAGHLALAAAIVSVIAAIGSAVWVLVVGK